MNIENRYSQHSFLYSRATLILHREGDRLINVENSRYMATRIPGAKYIELKGDDHLPWFGDSETILAEIEEFLTGVRPVAAVERVLSTVLFVDVVGSTEHAVSIGDSRWPRCFGPVSSVCKTGDRSLSRTID